jgi:hypothetical protein
MEIGTILGVVILAAVATLAALFTKGAGPDWSWKLGRKDPIRNMLFREDGSWRRYGRLGIVLAITLLVYLGYVGTR